MCELLLSGFADEASATKSIDEQFSVFAAIGLNYVSLRFLDLGSGVQNVIDLDNQQLAIVKRKLNEYELKVSSVGSPIGKTKLLDIDDGTANSYFNFEKYLSNQVSRVCQIAKILDCKLIRGFSFYQPKGQNPNDFVDEAAKRLSAIAEACDQSGLTFGLEVEANLVGHNAKTLTKIHDAVASDAMVLIFDGANLVTQGYSKCEIVQQFVEMQNAIGWIHVKDHQPLACPANEGYIDEDELHQFVPAGLGEGGYPEVLQELKSSFDKIQNRMSAREIDGVFADLEPHLQSGGQFGGYSGPAGFGIATRAFCKLCDQANISYRLRDHDSIS